MAIVYNDEGQPLCARCGERVRYELTRRSTGESYFWTYCQECENARQAEKRASKRMPDRVDDLVQISGLGEASEALLNKAGIWNFEQLAAMTAEDLLEIGIPARSRPAGWIAQAEAFVVVGEAGGDEEE